MWPWLGQLIGTRSLRTRTDPRRAELSMSDGRHLTAIDALRALAVVAVMIFHMQSSWLPGGFAGVDVFLVISGYVISRSMLKLDSTGLLRFTGAFYARRARRILPALLVCLSVIAVAAALFIPSSWLAKTNQQTTSYAFWGLSNYFMMHYGDPYFAPRIDYNPSAHTWSLGVEEQFYWLYPLVFFAWLKLRARSNTGRHIAEPLLPMLTLASLAYSTYLTARGQSAAAYYSLPSRFWELGAGALLFQLHADRIPTARARGAQLWVSFALIMVSLVFSRGTAFPVPWAIFAILGTAGFIDGAVMAGNGRSVRVLSHALPVWLGTRSYSLYLWHWPVYVLLRWTTGLETAAIRVLAVVLIAALSEASYRWVETPFRRGLRRAPSLAVIAAALGCVSVLWLSANAVAEHRERFSLSVTRQTNIWYPSWWPQEEVLESGCHVLRFYDSFAGGSRLESRHSGCPAVRTVHVFVTGNSHALAYSTLLARLTREQPYDATMYYRSDCAFMALTGAPSAETPICRAYYAAILADLRKRARPGDVLFLPSLRLPRLGDEWVIFSERTVQDEWRQLMAAQPAAVAEAARTLRPVEDLGVRVIFEAPKPVFGSPPFRCSDWFNRHNPVCAAGFTPAPGSDAQLPPPVLQELQGLQNASISIWDPFDTLCPSSTCAAISGGTPLFFDGDHLSGYGNELLYPSFVKFLLSR